MASPRARRCHSALSSRRYDRTGEEYVAIAAEMIIGSLEDLAGRSVERTQDVWLFHHRLPEWAKQKSGVEVYLPIDDRQRASIPVFRETSVRSIFYTSRPVAVRADRRLWLNEFQSWSCSYVAVAECESTHGRLTPILRQAKKYTHMLLCKKCVQDDTRIRTPTRSQLNPIIKITLDA